MHDVRTVSYKTLNERYRRHEQETVRKNRRSAFVSIGGLVLAGVALWTIIPDNDDEQGEDTAGGTYIRGWSGGGGVSGSDIARGGFGSSGGSGSSS